MPTPCAKCPLRRLEIFRKFSAEELAFVSFFKSGELVLEAGSTIFSEGTNSPHLYTVLSGWAFKYKTLEDGRRQVLNFALPGDFIGLQASILDVIGHSVEALTDVTLCVFPREKLWSLYEKHTGLAFDVTWLGAREESILGDYLLTVGQRRAGERIAFVLLHLFHRARQLGLDQGQRRGAADHAGASCRHHRLLAGPHQQDAEAAAETGCLQVDRVDLRGGRRGEARSPGRARQASIGGVRPFI